MEISLPLLQSALQTLYGDPDPQVFILSITKVCNKLSRINMLPKNGWSKLKEIRPLGTGHSNF